MDTPKKYNPMEDCGTGMVSEPLGAYNATISPLDALWTLVMAQAEDVQRGLELRLRHLLSQRKDASTPYTAEELHERITISEEQFSQGECFSHAEVQAKVKQLFESWN